MTDPFRDQLTAALERVEELEADNKDLRARVDSQANTDEEASTAAKTSQAVAANLQRETNELRDELARTQKDLLEARRAPKTAAPLEDRPRSFDIATFGAGMFLGAILGIVLGHC